MIEDLAMLANVPVVDEETAAKVQAEADKAVAAETMPPPKDKTSPANDNAEAERVDRRGQDAPEQEEAGEEDRG